MIGNVHLPTINFQGDNCMLSGGFHGEFGPRCWLKKDSTATRYTHSVPKKTKRPPRGDLFRELMELMLWHAFKFQICSHNCWDVMLWRGNRNGFTFGCVLFLYCQSCFGVACVGVCQSWCLIHQMQLLTNPTYTTWSFKYPRNSTTIEIILVCRVLFHNTGAPISSTSHAQRNNDNKRAYKPILIGWCSWWYPGFQLHLVLQPMFPTVDGRNSALNIPLFTGFCTSQVV